MTRKRMMAAISIIVMMIYVLSINTAGAMPLPQGEEATEEITIANPDSKEAAVTNEEGINEETAGPDSEIEAETVETEAEKTTETEEAEPTPEPVEPPEAPVLKNPLGEIKSGAVGFYWNPSERAAYYELSLKNEYGDEDLWQMEADDWTCAMNRCILYAELPYGGNYTWTVTAINEGGTAISEEMNFSVLATLPVSDAYRPNSTLSNQKPLVFEFADTGSSVSAYRIQVTDAETDQICLDVLYDVSAMNHVNGICYLESSEYLPTGSYAWRVQAVNGETHGGWSGWMPFEVRCTECELGTYLNTQIKTIFPNGITTNTEPDFVWQTVTGALNYQLEIKDSKEAIILDESVPSENCQTELCTYKPELTLSENESYTWSVTAYGWNNSFWGAASGAFSVVPLAADLNEIQFVGPENSASLDPDNQQIIWTDPGESTAAFRLGIRDKDGEWLFVSDLSRADAWCDGITCSIQFYTIPEGEDFEIVVIPYSEFNTPGNPISMSFSNLPEETAEESAEEQNES